MTVATSENSASPAPQKKKRSWGKIILKLFVLMMVLLVLGVVTLYFARNTLVRAGVIRGGKYATDQDTGLLSADLGLGSGRLNLAQFDIANLKGYKEAKFLAMKECEVQVQPGSIFSDTVVVDHIKITGTEIWLETNQGFKNNLSELMEVLKKKTPAADTAPPGAAPATPQSPGKKLKISKLTLSSTKVHIRGLVTMDLDLGPIEMDDPTNPDGRPMKIADVIGKVLIHVAKQIVENPLVPGNIKDGMKNVEALVNNLSKDLQKDLSKGLKGLGDVGKTVQDATKGLQDVGKNIPDIGKGLPDAGKGVQDATKGLQNLLGGNRTTQPK